MMKQLHPSVSLEELCWIFGKSRQGWYQLHQRSESRAEFHGLVLGFVKAERELQPRVGSRKLHHLVNGRLAALGLSIGRDHLIELLRSHGLLLRRRKRKGPPKTNGNGESIYPDLRKALLVNEINVLWCCDITYLELKGRRGFCYCTLISDEYSHLILGYHVSDSLTAEQTLKALQMGVESQAEAGQKFGFKLVFHTDRGSQFKSGLFSRYLDHWEIRQSMCAAGKSYENPVAERLNGILKQELLLERPFESLQQARQMLTRAVQIYNQRRPHMSCNMLTPSEAHKAGQAPLKKRWKGRKRRAKKSQDLPP